MGKGCCEKKGLRKGRWSREEDKKLLSYILLSHEHGNWHTLPKRAGLSRCGKSCRFRWMNYLRPDIKRGNYSKEEEETIIKMHQMLGNRWSVIAARLPGRTDNEVKNFWHTHLQKRMNVKNAIGVTKEHSTVASESNANPIKVFQSMSSHPNTIWNRPDSTLMSPQLSSNNQSTGIDSSVTMSKFMKLQASSEMYGKFSSQALWEEGIFNMQEDSSSTLNNPGLGFPPSQLRFGEYYGECTCLECQFYNEMEYGFNNSLEGGEHVFSQCNL